LTKVNLSFFSSRVTGMNLNRKKRRGVLVRLVASSCASCLAFLSVLGGESFCRAWLRELIVSTLFQTLLQKAGGGYTAGERKGHTRRGFIRPRAYHPFSSGVLFLSVFRRPAGESTLFLELDFSE
jgi:hypothetical protein